jgi:GTP diphosphokinase / guanosine-3',5'-bis(diphosphate) 3'-diphosphatase
MDGSALSAQEQGAGSDAGKIASASGAEALPPVPTREELIAKVRAYHPRVKSELLGQAYDFAKKHHGIQTRDSGEAYYSHPIRVASLLADVRLDEVTIVAGLLHDVVEDTDIDIGDIEVRFGAEVAELVDGVTKLDKLEFTSKEEAQAENFQKFILAMTSDIRVLLVKLADRLHNMETLHFRKKPESRQRTARETMDIYAPLARRVGLYDVAARMDDLAFKELNPDARRAILFRLEELEKENEGELDRIRDALTKLLDGTGIPYRLRGRRKQPYSLWRKLERKSISFRDVADLFAFRIVLKDVKDCYAVLGVIHTYWACIPDRFRDFISVPKPNGYASLHTTVRASGNRRVELQIRTAAMDRTAEYGVAAHWGYKNRAYGFDVDSARAAGLDPEANLKAFAELLRDGAEPGEFLEHAKLEMYREHVFTFSPKGKLIILPAGAMPLDFAYAVHSAVGDTAIGARINGEEKSMRRPLKNGDVVDIIRGRKIAPVIGWEAMTFTGRAKSKQRKLERDREAAEFRRLGEGLINQALRRAGADPLDVNLADVTAQFGAASVEDLQEETGRGRVQTAAIIHALFPGYQPERIANAEKTPIDSRHAPLFVEGQGLMPGVTLHLGQCCRPLPGDRIIGVQVPEKGLVVHISSCPRLAAYDDQPDLWRDLKWTELAKTGAVAVARIRINAANQRGVLAKLCSAVAESNGNIVGISTGARQPDFIELLMDIEVEDLKRLTQILAALRSLAVVDRAVRDQEGQDDQ